MWYMLVLLAILVAVSGGLLNRAFTMIRDLSERLRYADENIKVLENKLYWVSFPKSDRGPFIMVASRDHVREVHEKLYHLMKALGYQWVESDSTLPKMVKTGRKK